MGSYFLDTSAIVKHYVPEQGHAWIVTLCDSVQSHELYISQAALVEVVAAMCRRTREQSMTIIDRDRLISTFRQDCHNFFNIWPVTTVVYTIAGDLCCSYSLRAYDAVQLACVLALRSKALAALAPAPIFVCADVNLINIALSVELSIENPNNYP
jgi:predicted nucleic acid-binding protein